MTLRYEHLLGLEWEHGTRDCYALLRDVYRDNWGIELRDYARPQEWWDAAPELDLISRNFRNEGFTPLPIDNHLDMRPGDVLLIARGTTIVSHCAVWVGGNRFLHHPYQGVSRLEQWAGKWAGSTLAVLRHPDVPPPPPPSVVDVIELLPHHMRSRFRARAS